MTAGSPKHSKAAAKPAADSTQSAAELEALLAQAGLARQPAPETTDAEPVADELSADDGEGDDDELADDAPAAPSVVEAELAAGPVRCGVIAIVGKPNVGKSTLLNALVGQKISITSRKAQTTRHRITGIRTLGQTQFIFVDTPGFQTRHATALNKSLNKTVMGAVGDVDLVLFVVEAGSFTLADAKVLSLLKPGVPALLVANKLDRVHRRAEIAPWLRDMQGRHDFTEFVPMSAKSRGDVERLFGICAKYLPEQAWWYGEDELTDRSEKFLASETVREKLFRFTGDELPYTSTVVIDKFDEEKSKSKTHSRFLRIAATIVVERDGHKAMVIGEKGERLKRIGTEARQELEKILGCKVFLELWVKVRSGWADDEARVRSFGYE
ncbi:MAG: GTPase Era [Paracidovorax wautersii]|uniref:GTPase Era n=1 Tax=Paracidovorax wautersii TaxID=1177982 RepID=A0A7V8FLW7_9BURK|nr:MAG: GTPase Era [Paracidovorax wautersii]